MAYTDINSEDRLVQATFAEHLEQQLGWESVCAWNSETFGPDGLLGRTDTRDVVLVRDLRAALVKLNPELPAAAIGDAVAALTRHDHTRSLVQHNRSFHTLLRDGVPVSWRDASGQPRQTQARVIDFRDPLNNRFLAVRELKITGLHKLSAEGGEAGQDGATRRFTLARREGSSPQVRDLWAPQFSTQTAFVLTSDIQL